MLDQRLAIDAHALLPGTPDRLVGLLAGDVHDVDGHAGGIGDHDGAVGGLAFDLRRTAEGVALPGRSDPRFIYFSGSAATTSPFSA